ncbi:thioredoxin family protein [Salipiger abyssi]|uniref:thioredoxin family protein n=1 Tax=Salipiger abyssi TaxID=1250539 RepID=UPI001A8C3650|nr:thioredoxin family protein [Salipiger abyssi]MBN9889453.1 thioredoxin family protein [Salipiger abyssi]
MAVIKSLAGAALSVLLLAGSAMAEIRLVMVEQPGCAYCAAWNAQIAPAYPNTAEGRFAPLLRADLRQGPPEGVTYKRKVLFTPTFILIEDGDELARLEGYPGEDFFWPLLSQLLERHTDFDPAAVLVTPAEPLEGG